MAKHLGVTEVYRHFDGEGTLLYVGITSDADRRLKEHERESFWFRDIAKMTVETFLTRAEADAAETWIARNEHPLYNRRKRAIPYAEFIGPIDMRPHPDENFAADRARAKVRKSLAPR